MSAMTEKLLRGWASHARVAEAWVSGLVRPLMLVTSTAPSPSMTSILAKEIPEAFCS